jgi:hypothetical protein
MRCIWSLRAKCLTLYPKYYYICVFILLCPTIYVSSYYYVPQELQGEMPARACTTIYVSSYYYICVLILVCVLIPVCISGAAGRNACALTYYYICVLILLYTTICVCSHHYVLLFTCVLTLVCISGAAGRNASAHPAGIFIDKIDKK